MTLYHLHGQQKGVATSVHQLCQGQRRGAGYLKTPAGEGQHRVFMGNVTPEASAILAHDEQMLAGW